MKTLVIPYESRFYNNMESHEYYDNEMFISFGHEMKVNTDTISRISEETTYTQKKVEEEVELTKGLFGKKKTKVKKLVPFDEIKIYTITFMDGVTIKTITNPLED